MKSLPGPFLPDRNISVAMLAFEDRAWVILRRALHDTASHANTGVVTLSGVRSYRARDVEEEEMTRLMEGVEPTFWALELDATDYLAESLADTRNPPVDPSRYHHFVVTNGWHRVIDVIAERASCDTLSDNATVTINDLLAQTFLDSGATHPFGDAQEQKI